jgi:putative DNA primase/helicase
MTDDPLPGAVMIPGEIVAGRNGAHSPPGVSPEFAEAMRERHADPLSWPLTLQMTHTGNAARFAAKFGDRVRYTVGRGWLVWDGKRWAPDVNEATVTGYMQQVARDWYDQAGCEQNEDLRKLIGRHASRTLNREGLVNSLACASKIPGILADDDDFDADPFLLNTPSGIVDLRTGKIGAHDTAKLCSRITGAEYDPDAHAPRWQRFLSEVFAGDEALVTFVRRWCGYCLTGDTREQRYVIAWGGGENGKSTLFDALRAVMGDYATDISTAALAAKRES